MLVNLKIEHLSMLNLCEGKESKIPSITYYKIKENFNLRTRNNGKVSKMFFPVV